MKLTTHFLRAQMQRVFGVARMGPAYMTRTILRTRLTECRHSSIAGLILPIYLCLANPISAQLGDINEYCSTDTPLAIPDKDTVISELNISETSRIIDLNVRVTISHSYDANLDVFLIAPDGTRIELFTDVGGTSDNFEDTILDDEADLSIKDGSAPFTGSFRPEGRLAEIVNMDIQGLWSLEVTDDWRNDTGTLESWCLIVKLPSTEPLPPPVIDVKSEPLAGMRKTVFWDDVGQTTEYESTLPEEDFYDGTLAGIIAIVDSGMIEDLNVKVNISHEPASRIDVHLIAPDGTRIELFTDLPGSQDSFTDTILDDQSSTPITDGTAPFTGRYRPEGALDDLIGKDIHGEWTLEITDHSWDTSERLNRWSLIADLADVIYYVECAAEADFGTVVASSGWIVSRSHVFDGLDPKNERWYRAKAKPLRTWSQTGMVDFQANALTDITATRVGDAVLASVDDLGPEVNVIPNPSFEISNGGWAGVKTEDNTFIGRVRYLWASDGEWAGCVEFRPTGLSAVGSYGYQHIPVDWTGVDTLIFDYMSYFSATGLRPSALIGEKELWSEKVDHDFETSHYDIIVDVSGFTGYQDLRLKVESLIDGYVDAGIAWDNLRTYGSLGYVSSGSTVSTPISLREGDTWDIVEFSTTTPAGTVLTIDVLPATGSTPIDGYDNILSGTDISGLSERTIRLRADLSRNDVVEATPALHDWSVTYIQAFRESDWSNVVSSLP